MASKYNGQDRIVNGGCKGDACVARTESDGSGETESES